MLTAARYTANESLRLSTSEQFRSDLRVVSGLDLTYFLLVLL